MLVMGSYLLGMIPALMFGGPLADRFGRKPFTLAALAFSVLGSLALMGGWYTEAGLYLGRVFTGLGMGLAMVAVTSWVKLISPGPAGATRAALCTSAGFAIGSPARLSDPARAPNSPTLSTRSPRWPGCC